MPGFDPLAVFLSAFGVSAFAGLAALLRPGKSVTFLAVASSMLYSGLMGLAISLIWYKYFCAQDNIYLLIGICVLAGLGGNSFTDFLLYILKKGGVTISVVRDVSDEPKTWKD
jgi:hypothetical protein